MVIQIDVQPETEELLKRELATGRSLSVDEVIRRGIQATPMPNVADLPRKPFSSAQERAAAFWAWTESIPERGFYLPDEALERESFYGERG